MTEKELNNRYFEWMYQLVYDKQYTRGLSYKKLLSCLHDIEFQYSMPMDDNRAGDGIDLRYRFAYENEYESSMIASCIDNCPCSVLEMIAALALRCESIMYDPDAGNRTGRWFWTMIDSLGLMPMDDSNFDEIYVEDVIFRFMDRGYKRNGSGGLFTIKHCKYDMRSTEIWWQMNWYLESILDKKKGE